MALLSTARITALEADVVEEGRCIVNSSEMPTVNERVAHVEGQLGLLIKVLGGTAAILLLALGWGATSLISQNTRLAVVESFFPEQRLKQIAENPTAPENIESAKKFLDAARKQSLRIDPGLLAETGQKFVLAAKENTDSWGAAQKFLNYRSFLNETATPKFPGPGETITLSPTIVRLFWKKESPKLSAYGFAAQPQSAVLEPIGQNLNPDQASYRRQLIVAEGGDVFIDGLRMKNVIFRNAHVMYLGGAV